MTQRIDRLFSHLSSEGRPAMISFTMAGDPNLETSEAILHSLPAAGVDMVELGMPFSDPTADGPSIQAAGMRALLAGTKTHHILAMAERFRLAHPDVPLILMGYYNPILHYGAEKFAKDAAQAGVDGLIIVDLPPEEEDEMRIPMEKYGLALVRLIAPTTDDTRLARLLKTATGFVYTIAVKGITGTASAHSNELAARVAHIKRLSSLPVVAGFGIRTPQQVRDLQASVDGVVVGSAIVEIIGQHTAQGGALIGEVSQFVRSLRSALQP